MIPTLCYLYDKLKLHSNSFESNYIETRIPTYYVLIIEIVLIRLLHFKLV